MIRFGVWHGGPNYSTLDYSAHLEMWEDLGLAKRALQVRKANMRDHFQYADPISSESGLFEMGKLQYLDIPLVDWSECYIDLYPVVDTYGKLAADVIYNRLYVIGGEPYARLSLGPRGGVKMESF